jgi:hypothetical protein
MHSLNNAIGYKWQSRQDMQQALQAYIEEAAREGLPEHRRDHASPGGWYSSEVLAFAVRATDMTHLNRQVYNMQLTPLEVHPELIHHCAGAIVNKANEHWVALRSHGDVIWLHDSMESAPTALTYEEYIAFVTEFTDAYPIMRI